MVFQDYELIHTKRVNRVRASQDPYYQRLAIATGGLNTLYFTAVFAVGGYQFNRLLGNYNQ